MQESQLPPQQLWLLVSRSQTPACFPNVPRLPPSSGVSLLQALRRRRCSPASPEHEHYTQWLSVHIVRRISLLQPRLFQYRRLRSRVEFLGRMSRYRNDPRFRGVAIVPVTSANPNYLPAVAFDELDRVSDLHPKLFCVNFGAKDHRSQRERRRKPMKQTICFISVLLTWACLASPNSRFTVCWLKHSPTCAMLLSSRKQILQQQALLYLLISTLLLQYRPRCL